LPIGVVRPRVSSVLDASALLAAINGELGADRVRQATAQDGAVIGAVNLAEVITKLVERGFDDRAIRATVSAAQLQVVPFDEDLAYRAALLRIATRTAGLSLGDRACLALADRLGLPALTADRTWATLQLGVQVEVIR
jgi:ribonuclease VapC